jgi:hypothetical protein
MPVPILVAAPGVDAVLVRPERCAVVDGRPGGGRYFVDACMAAFDRLAAESATVGVCSASRCILPDRAAPPHRPPARDLGPHLWPRRVWHATGDEIAGIPGARSARSGPRGRGQSAAEAARGRPWCAARVSCRRPALRRRSAAGMDHGTT